MPTYDLECRDCGMRFEKFLTRLLAAQDKVCPSCGSVDVRTGVGGGFLGARITSSKSATRTSASCSSGRFA